jgi:hypothetical protein
MTGGDDFVHEFEPAFVPNFFVEAPNDGLAVG